MGKIVKRIPSTENGHGTIYTATGGNVYRITKHVNKPWFFLWRQVSGGYEKLAEMDSPYSLYVLIDQMEGVTTDEAR